MIPTDDEIRYRIVMQPIALQAVLANIERTRTMALEFVYDLESARRAEALIHEEVVALIRAVAESRTSDELEGALRARSQARRERSELARRMRRVEAEELVAQTLAEMDDMPQDHETVIKMRALLSDLPRMAEEAPDEVTLELLWDQRARELGIDFSEDS